MASALKCWFHLMMGLNNCKLEHTHGFQSSMEPCLIFGLGKRASVTVKIFWQDGTTQTIKDQPVNKTILLEQKNAVHADEKEKSLLLCSLKLPVAMLASRI